MANTLYGQLGSQLWSQPSSANTAARRGRRRMYKNNTYSDTSHAYFTYQNKFHKFSIVRCAKGLQVIPDWQTWLNSNSQIWNPERKPSHFIRQWWEITEILNILVNSSIFNMQLCTKSNALLSNVKSTYYYIQLQRAKPEQLEKSTFHDRQKIEYFL